VEEPFDGRSRGPGVEAPHLPQSVFKNSPCRAMALTVDPCAIGIQIALSPSRFLEQLPRNRAPMRTPARGRRCHWSGSPTPPNNRRAVTDGRRCLKAR